MHSFYPNSPTAKVTAHTQLRIELWTEAYDRLEKDETHLIDAYRIILSLRLHEYSSASAVIVSQETDSKKIDPEEWQQILRDIIETTFKASKSGTSTKQPLDDCKENLEFVKQMINSITVGGGELAFAWVGICLALKVQLHWVENAPSTLTLSSFYSNQ